MSTTEHKKLQYKVTKANREYFDDSDKPKDWQFENAVLILKEGLCLWSYLHKKYYQVFSLDGIRGMLMAYYPENWSRDENANREFDGELRKQKIMAQHPHVTESMALYRLASREKSEEADRFNLRKYDDRHWDSEFDL